MSEQLEAVDFYSGHKSTLEYLGTIWVVDGSPEGLRARQRFTDEQLPEEELFVEADFRAAVEQLMVRPDQAESTRSWPHGYRNSINTPWSYRYHTGTVFVMQGGHVVQTFLCNGSREPYQYFPNLGGQVS